MFTTIRSFLLKCKSWIEETLKSANVWLRRQLNKLNSLVLNALGIGCATGGAYACVWSAKTYSPICKPALNKLFVLMSTPKGVFITLLIVSLAMWLLSCLLNDMHQDNLDKMRNHFDAPQLDINMFVNVKMGA